MGRGCCELVAFPMDRGEAAVCSEHTLVLGGVDGALTLPARIAMGMSPCVFSVSPAALWLSPAHIISKNSEPRAAGTSFRGWVSVTTTGQLQPVLQLESGHKVMNFLQTLWESEQNLGVFFKESSTMAQAFQGETLQGMGSRDMRVRAAGGLW